MHEFRDLSNKLVNYIVVSIGYNCHDQIFVNFYLDDVNSGSPLNLRNENWNVNFKNRKSYACLDLRCQVLEVPV